MSTRNDKDEPLTTGDEAASTFAEPSLRAGSADIPPSPPAPRATSFGGGDDGGGGRRDDGRSPAGFFDRLRIFIAETRAELRRVSWPSTTEVRNTTIITIVAVVFFAAYLFVVDRAFTFLIEGLTSLLSRVI